MRVLWGAKSSHKREWESGIKRLVDNKGWELIPVDRPYRSFSRLVKSEFGCDATAFIDFLKAVGVSQDLLDALRENAYPDERANNGANQYTGPKVESTQVVENPKERADRSKAISRAPRIVRELYDSGVLGINEAVKLGPKVNNRKPTPEQLEQKESADRIAMQLERFVESNPIPESKSERPSYKRKVNQVVREMMGESASVHRFTVSQGTTPQAFAAALYEKLPQEFLAEMVAALTEVLTG